MANETATELELRETRERLHQVCVALEKAREETIVATCRAGEFKQVADNMKLQLDGAARQLEKLAQHKMHMVDAQNVMDELVTTKQRLADTEAHVKILTSVRDEGTTRISDLRFKIFELENGLDGRLAAAEGKALYYKEKLTNMVLFLQDAMKVGLSGLRGLEEEATALEADLRTTRR